MLEKESLKEKFIKRGFWLYFFTFITAPIGFFITLMLGNSLSKEEFGLFYLAFGLITLLSPYTDFGLTESLNYFLPKYIIKSDYARAKYLMFTVTSVQVCTSVTMALILFFGAEWLAEYYFQSTSAKELIRILSLYFIGSHLFQITSTFFSAIQNTKIQKLTEFLRMFSILLSILWIYFFGDRTILSYAWGWLIGISLGFLISLSIFYFSYYRDYFQIQIERDLALRKEFFQYSIGTLVSANIGMLLHQLDMQFIGYFISSEEAGDYKVYQSVVSIAFLFFSPIIGFLYPVISEIGARKEYEKIHMISGFFGSYLSVFMVWCSMCYMIVGSSLSVLFFGIRYQDVGYALMFIAPFLVLNILIQINFQILAGLGYIKKRVLILLATLGANSILCVTFILSYKYNILPFPNGSSAASLSVGLSWIVMWYLSYRAIALYVKGFLWSFFGKNILGALSASLLYIFANSQFDFASLYEGRMGAFLDISIALLISMIIFFMINWSHLKEFFRTIQTVKTKSPTPNHS